MQTRIFFFFLDNIVIFLHRCHFYNLLYLLYLLCFVVTSYKQSLLLNVFIECLYFFSFTVSFMKSCDENYPKKKPFSLNRGKKWQKTGERSKLATVLNRGTLSLESALSPFPQKFQKYHVNCLIAVFFYLIGTKVIVKCPTHLIISTILQRRKR